MNSLLLLALVVGLVPAPKTEDINENPLRNAKVGDWVEYSMSVSVLGMDIKGTMKITVTAKSDAEAAIKSSVTMNGLEQAGQETKIDLNVPFDPIRNLGQLAGKDGSLAMEKTADGKEKLKVGNRELDAGWTTYKATQSLNGTSIELNMKLWTSKTIPVTGMARMEFSGTVSDMPMKGTYEFSGSGGK